MVDTQKNWMERSLIEIAALSDIEMNEQSLSIITNEQFKSALTEMIAHLLDHHFEKLLWILYRIDVDEEKAKALLSKHLPEHAPMILAELIMHRQQQKEEFKKQFQAKQESDVDDDLRM